VLNALKSICPKISSLVDTSKVTMFTYFILTSSQCEAFVNLFGPYVAKLLETKIEPSSICTDSLGLCTNSQYTMLFPDYEGNNVTWHAVQKNVLPGSTFRYKLFLGGNSSLTQSNTNFDVNITLTSVIANIRMNSTYKMYIKPNVNGTVILQDEYARLGEWYYIDIDINKLIKPHSQFTLDAVFYSKSFFILISLTIQHSLSIIH
jgi:hypothetical protein